MPIKQVFDTKAEYLTNRDGSFALNEVNKPMPNPWFKAKPQWYVITDGSLVGHFGAFRAGEACQLPKAYGDELVRISGLSNSERIAAGFNDLRIEPLGGEPTPKDAIERRYAYWSDRENREVGWGASSQEEIEKFLGKHDPNARVAAGSW